MDANAYAAALEAHRREPPSPTLHNTPAHGPLLDYASAGLKVDVALHHLDESLPGRQRARTTLAFKALREGVEELAVWLRANGYDV